MRSLNEIKEIKYNEIRIFDNVHGFVRITKAEEEIINSIYFQRLRDLKQLGLGYYMFPGAVHTRFAHSIGVLAVMDRIVSKLEEQCKENIDIEDVLVLRMAALLHDIGHYPLSHTIENVYKKYHGQFIMKFDEDDDDNQNAKQEMCNDNKYRELLNGVDGHHEQLGAYIVKNTDFKGGITYILKQNGFNETNIDDIAKTIMGKCRIHWYNQVLHSDLDADRLDYLLRDSVNTGVEFGGFDFDYIINNCRLYKEPKHTNSKIQQEIKFCIKESACFTVEHFLMTRYYWYAKIIYEKKLTLFEKMAQSLYLWLLEKDKALNYIQILKSIEKPEEFIFFNDNYFYEKLKWVLSSDEAKELPDYDQFKKLAAMIVERRTFNKIESHTEREEKADIREQSIDIEKDVVYKDQKYKDNKDIIKITNIIDVCKMTKEIEFSKTIDDPIQIVSKENEVTNIIDRGYSILMELSKYRLKIERTYSRFFDNLDMDKVAENMNHL